MDKMPFDNEKFVGYISKVTPYFSTIHFPSSTLLKKFWHYHEELTGGVVGQYVVIEGENYGFLGKIQEIALPEKEQVFLGENSFYNSDFHPQGKLEILLSFNYYSDKIEKGLDRYPAVGSKVYLCSSELLKELFLKAKDGTHEFDIAQLPDHLQTSLPLNPNDLFGRHCAIVGTTGSGKSYTIARILEEFIAKSRSKAILIDATGEYERFYNLDKVKVVKFGDPTESTFFHYSRLRVMDLVALFRPSEGTQKPKLIEAIKSLKLVKALQEEHNSTTDNIYAKAGTLKALYYSAYREHRQAVESEISDFDLSNLTHQIHEECIKSGTRTNFGDTNLSERNYVSSLISRIESIRSNRYFKTSFGFDKEANDENEFNAQLENFLSNDSEEQLFIISLKDASFEKGIREILVNAIGSYLLEEARDYKFKEAPIVLFLDEAHQFLKKTITDDFFNDLELDAFDKIAKECRKHGLFLCISTQMPRDIPIGTLSQMGTFIVHRLINEFDRSVIEKACSEGNKNSLAYLPMLKAGEALLVSIEMPMPIMIKMKEPMIKPYSDTPKLL